MAERRLRSSEAVFGSSELQSARDRSQLSLSGPRLVLSLSHNQPSPATSLLPRHRLLCIIPIILLNFCGPPSIPCRNRPLSSPRCRQLEPVSASQEIHTRSQSQRRIERTQPYSAPLQVLARRMVPCPMVYGTREVVPTLSGPSKIPRVHYTLNYS